MPFIESVSKVMPIEIFLSSVSPSWPIVAREELKEICAVVTFWGEPDRVVSTIREASDTFTIWIRPLENTARIRRFVRSLTEMTPS